MKVAWKWMALGLLCGVVACEDWTRLSIDSREPQEEAPATPAPPSDENPPANPAPNNETAPQPPSPAEPIDLSQVRWLHTDVSGWPVTTTLRARISGGSIILEYDKARVWPAVDGVNANPWIFVQRDGVWYAATWEWLRFGQTSKPTSVVNGGHIKKAPLDNFEPRSGETYGFMVSGLARTNVRNVRERSNIVMLTWP